MRLFAVGLASTIHLVSTSGPITNNEVNRYGDYTATVVAPDGSVWTAGMSSLPTTVTNGQENWCEFDTPSSSADREKGTGYIS